jgi:hypothetical protein
MGRSGFNAAQSSAWTCAATTAGASYTLDAGTQEAVVPSVPSQEEGRKAEARHALLFQRRGYSWRVIS